MGFNEQRITLSTLQNHIKPASKSDLFIKSVLFDKAKFDYKGFIRIENEVQKSEAYQKNQTILLSADSQIDSKPYLEILTNDVICTHATTVDHLDKNKLFYLTSRGIGKFQATKLLITGFFQEILARIPDKRLRVELEKKLSISIAKLLERRKALYEKND